MASAAIVGRAGRAPRLRAGIVLGLVLGTPGTKLISQSVAHSLSEARGIVISKCPAPTHEVTYDSAEGDFCTACENLRDCQSFTVPASEVKVRATSGSAWKFDNGKRPNPLPTLGRTVYCGLLKVKSQPLRGPFLFKHVKAHTRDSNLVALLDQRRGMRQGRESGFLLAIQFEFLGMQLASIHLFEGDLGRAMAAQSCDGLKGSSAEKLLCRFVVDFNDDLRPMGRRLKLIPTGSTVPGLSRPLLVGTRSNVKMEFDRFPAAAEVYMKAPDVEKMPIIGSWVSGLVKPNGDKERKLGMDLHWVIEAEKGKADENPEQILGGIALNRYVIPEAAP